MYLAQGDVEGFDVFEELQCAFIGYSTVFECANTLLAGHDVFANAFGAGVLQELVRSEI